MSLDYIYPDNSKIANQKHISTYHDSKFAKNIQYEKDINVFFSLLQKIFQKIIFYRILGV